MNAKDGSGKVRSTQRALGVLIARLEDSLNRLLGEAHAKDDFDARGQTSVLLTQAVGVSVHSIRVLLDRSFMGARDAFGVSRSICEAAVNACYFLCADTGVVEKAHRHALQKIHRENTKTASVGGVTINVRPGLRVKVDDLPGLADALAEFTRKSGAEIRDWTDKSIDDRINFVAREAPRVGQCLAASRLLIYGVSSEIIHGSPYGVIYFWTGLSGSSRLKETGRYQMMVHYLTAVVGAAYAVNALVLIYREKLGFKVAGWNETAIFEAFQRLVDIGGVRTNGVEVSTGKI